MEEMIHLQVKEEELWLLVHGLMVLSPDNAADQERQEELLIYLETKAEELDDESC